MVPIDRLIRSRRKTIALIIEHDGRLIVRAPLRAKEEAIHRFVAQKEQWIRSKQQQFRARSGAISPKQYIEGEPFLYLGEEIPLQLGEHKKPLLYLNSTFRLSRLAAAKAPLVFRRWYQRQALQVISERVECYARQHGYAYQRIRITSARTRWGSCTSRGTLSFSWRLIMAPLPIVDYVVLHELAHLEIHNHSSKFWARVEALVPDYREKREWLNTHGYLLSLD